MQGFFRHQHRTPALTIAPSAARQKSTYLTPSPKNTNAVRSEQCLVSTLIHSTWYWLKSVRLIKKPWGITLETRNETKLVTKKEYRCNMNAGYGNVSLYVPLTVASQFDGTHIRVRWRSDIRSDRSDISATMQLLIISWVDSIDYGNNSF